MLAIPSVFSRSNISCSRRLKSSRNLDFSRSVGLKYQGHWRGLPSVIIYACIFSHKCILFVQEVLPILCSQWLYKMSQEFVDWTELCSCMQQNVGSRTDPNTWIRHFIFIDQTYKKQNRIFFKTKTDSKKFFFKTYLNRAWVRTSGCLGSLCMKIC